MWIHREDIFLWLTAEKKEKPQAKVQTSMNCRDEDKENPLSAVGDRFKLGQTPAEGIFGLDYYYSVQ